MDGLVMFLSLPLVYIYIYIYENVSILGSCAHVCMPVYKPEMNIKCLVQWLFTLFFEIASFTEPEVPKFC